MLLAIVALAALAIPASASAASGVTITHKVFNSSATTRFYSNINVVIRNYTLHKHQFVCHVVWPPHHDEDGNRVLRTKRKITIVVYPARDVNRTYGKVFWGLGDVTTNADHNQYIFPKPIKNTCRK